MMSEFALRWLLWLPSRCRGRRRVVAGREREKTLHAKRLTPKKEEVSMHPSEFTLHAFLSWLHTVPLEKEVGRINHSRMCPLANFLLATSGKASLVRTRTYQSPSWEQVEDLPHWAAQFTFLLDHLYLLDERGAYRAIYNTTVTDCVYVLSRVLLWETGYVLLRPHAYLPVLPFVSSRFSANATRLTPHVTRPVVPLGSVLFAPLVAPVVPGIAADDDLSTSWLDEVR